ncbi:MAG: hypothetical protein IID37_01705 [Planctomycetes bacterium]|nr:hypothetical protein [Planctomycetota bacterium]
MRAYRPFELAGLALCVAAITTWSIPQPVSACTGTPPPPVCGKSTVLMKTPPTVFTFVPPTPPFILPVPVTVLIAASPAPPPPPCPFPLATTITLGGACVPLVIPPPFGAITITTTTPGTYTTAVPVAFPALAGPPPAFYVCTIVGGAATTWADFSATTGTGDTVVCLVEGIEDPDNPGEFIPRMDLERLTAEIQIAHPGDQRIHSYLLTNNDPTESVTVTLTADSEQTARLPESENDETGLGTGPFALADPGEGDNFPIAFVEDMDLSWIPLPPDPPSYGIPVITKEIMLQPGESRLVEIAQRSWPMCQSGSCSESRVIVEGTFSNGDPAAACAASVLLADSTVPPDLDCPDGGVMVAAVLQASNSVSFAGCMPTHLFDMSVSIPDVTITTEEAGVLSTSFESINLHQDKARITAAGSAMKGPATVVDSLFEVGFTIEVLSNHVEIDTEIINFILHAAVPGFGDTYFGVHPVARLTGADIPPDLETFFHAFTPGISVDGVTDDLHHLAEIVQDSITLEIIDPTHAAVSFLAVFPSDPKLPLEIDSIRVMIDSMGIATGIPGESELPVCCDSPALCDGDVNGDGAVDPLDGGAILARFGLDASDPANCQYDVNCDGGIDPLDSGYVLARFGLCIPPIECPIGGGSPGECSAGGGGDPPCPEPVGDCCEVHSEPGCDSVCGEPDDGGVAECVCNIDSFCCEVTWDQTCVYIVELFGCADCSECP